MDKTQQTFDSWAKSGRSELMQKEHANAVNGFFGRIKFEGPFSFLDVGCGNGWVVRKIASLKNCKKAVGIDKSANMIKVAKSKKTFPNEHYFHTDIQNWKYNGKFDFIFSMESIYYVESIELTLKKIYRILKHNGQFVCGTDFYKENRATSHWPKAMKIPMHLFSEKQWKENFKHAGFSVKIKHIKEKNSKKKWKQEKGTLFIIGKKS